MKEEKTIIKLTRDQILVLCGVFGSIFLFLLNIKMDVAVLKEQVSEMRNQKCGKQESSNKGENKKLVQMGTLPDSVKLKDYTYEN